MTQLSAAYQKSSSGKERCVAYGENEESRNQKQNINVFSELVKLLDNSNNNKILLITFPN